MAKKEDAILVVESAKVTPVADWPWRIRTNYLFLKEREPTRGLPDSAIRFIAFYQYLVRNGATKAEARAMAKEAGKKAVAAEVIEAVSFTPEQAEADKAARLKRSRLNSLRARGMAAARGA